ncbi:MAG: hypothetical protein ACLFMX_01280 [Halobacteriales archaeon]
MVDPTRVLHVDDDPDVVGLAGRYLDAAPIEVETATSVAEGHDYLRGGRSTASSRTTRCRA